MEMEVIELIQAINQTVVLIQGIVLLIISVAVFTVLMTLATYRRWG